MSNPVAERAEQYLASLHGYCNAPTALTIIHDLIAEIRRLEGIVRIGFSGVPKIDSDGKRIEGGAK